MGISRSERGAMVWGGLYWGVLGPGESMGDPGPGHLWDWRGLTGQFGGPSGRGGVSVRLGWSLVWSGLVWGGCVGAALQRLLGAAGSLGPVEHKGF